MNIIGERVKITRLSGGILFCYYVLGVNIWAFKNAMIEETLFLMGTILVAIGVIGRVWCLSYIGGNKDDILIKHGPYSICRNPLYLFSLIGAVGVGFGTETLVVPLMIFIVFLIYYPFVIRKEEAELKQKFGAEYENYLKNIKRRLIPSFGNYSELDRIEISPGAFRKGIFDLIYFIIFLGIFECIETAHIARWIPFYYYIY